MYQADRRFPVTRTWLALLFLVSGSLAAAAPPILERPEIRYLLQAVESSHCRFIRNGKSHTGTEAAAHLRKKARYFARSIHTPEDFIRLAASRSLLSGKPYLVQCQTNTGLPTRQQTTADWLWQKLNQWRHKRVTNI